MPSEDEILQLTSLIWEATLRLPIEPEPSCTAAAASTLSAHVRISGAWNGVVRLTCSTEVAAEAAGVMFGLSRPDTREADQRDAVGELVNMVGGNIKALLPEPCRLSTPSSDTDDFLVSGEVVQKVCLQSGGKPVCVELIETTRATTREGVATRT